MAAIPPDVLDKALAAAMEWLSETRTQIFRLTPDEEREAIRRLLEASLERCMENGDGRPGPRS